MVHSHFWKQERRKTWAGRSSVFYITSNSSLYHNCLCISHQVAVAEREYMFFVPKTIQSSLFTLALYFSMGDGRNASPVHLDITSGCALFACIEYGLFLPGAKSSPWDTRNSSRNCCAVALKPPEALVTQMDLEVWNSELQGQCRSSAVLSCMKMCLCYIAASPEQQ